MDDFIIQSKIQTFYLMELKFLANLKFQYRGRIWKNNIYRGKYQIYLYKITREFLIAWI